MPDEPTAGQSRMLGSDDIERLILGVLLDRHPALVALEELVRHFDYSRPEDSISPVFVREGVEELRRSGLAHQLDQFAFASFAAVRAHELDT
jgi:hypothetical protein